MRTCSQCTQIALLHDQVAEWEPGCRGGVRTSGTALGGFPERALQGGWGCLTGMGCGAYNVATLGCQLGVQEGSFRGNSSADQLHMALGEVTLPSSLDIQRLVLASL